MTVESEIDQEADQGGSNILVVDDDRAVRDVVTTLLAEEGYMVSATADAEAALTLAGRQDTHLIISDLKMPGHDGLWLLDQVRRESPDTSIIMLTGFGDTEAAVECLRRGATDYLLKPPKVTDLIRAIERALARRRIDLARRRYQKRLERKVQAKTAELTAALEEVGESYQNTLLALVAALDAREHETSDHSQRVVRYTRTIARIMGYDGEELAEIGRGALLHDIGKIGVPDSILLKPGPLTKTEWDEMRRHPAIGFRILEGIPFLRSSAEIVLSHQERFDGGGYPRGLVGEAIPIGARIFAVADALDAITSDRPYRKGQSYDAARAEIRAYRETQFDPACVDAFLTLDNDRLAAIRAAVFQLDG